MTGILGPLSERIEDVLYTLLSPLLLCNFQRRRTSLSTSSMSDEEIMELARVSPNVDANAYFEQYYGEEYPRPDPGHVAKIAPDAVAKNTAHAVEESESELFATNLVRSATSIPVPLCERVAVSTFGSLIVQEYVPGQTLWALWPKLGWWKRFRVVFTLRYYVRELRLLRTRMGDPSFPGRPSRVNVPLTCNGRLFTSEGSGPFNSYRDMARWYQNRLLVMQRYRDADPNCAPFDDSEPLVFTHMDLHPMNVILGDDGQLWVVDWEAAGWYPAWFEAVSMQWFSLGHSDTPSSWTKAIPFIADSCEKPGQMPFMRAIGYSISVLKNNIMNLIDLQEL